MTFSKFVFAALIFTVAAVSHAETILDKAIEFSINVPQDAKVEKGSIRDGSYVAVNFRDNLNQEVVIVQAMRITNSGKFREPIPEVFTKFVAGMSNQMKVAPASPIRTLAYQEQTMYVATHLNVSANLAPRQGMTTVGFFAEKGTWHKAIFLQFMSAANTELTDEAILKRLASLKYEPALHH